MTDDLHDVSSGVRYYKICHPRHGCLTVANSSGVGLSVPNRSIHKSHALPPGDSGYTKSRGFTSTPKGTMKKVSQSCIN